MTTGAALFAACTLLAACGKGGHVVSGAATATARTSAAPAAAPLTEQRAKAFARAVNLTNADLPTFRVQRSAAHAEAPGERRLQRGLAACIGVHAPAGGEGGGPSLPESHSPEFARRVSVITFTASSSISFSRSAQAAASELATLRSPHTRACLQRYVQALLRSRHLGGVTFKRVAIAQGNPPALGTTGGFGWRVTAYAGLKGISVPVYLDVLGFVYGTAEVRLLSTGLVAPFPAGVQERLYRTLVARARAQKL